MTTREAAQQLADRIDTDIAKLAEQVGVGLRAVEAMREELAAWRAVARGHQKLLDEHTEALAAIQGDTPALLPPAPDYTRHTPIKNESTGDVQLDGTTGYGIWITQGNHALGNVTLRGLKIDPDHPERKWIHGIYQSGGTLYIPVLDVSGLTERDARNHLAFYLSGGKKLHIGTLIIGRPGEWWDIPCKVKSKADPARRVEELRIDRVLAFGGARQLLKVENEDDDAQGILAAKRVIIGDLLWVDPGGDGEGRLEALRLYGVGKADIGSVTILDTKGVITKPVVCKASGTTGRIGKVRVYFPASLGDRELLQGISSDSVEVLEHPPAEPRPTTYAIDSADVWFKRAGGAA